MLNIRRKADSLHCMLQMDKPQALVVTLNIIKMIAAILYSVHSSNSVCKDKVCRNIGFQQPTIQTMEWLLIQVSTLFHSIITNCRCSRATTTTSMTSLKWPFYLACYNAATLFLSFILNVFIVKLED